jgi:hypothetical protein
MIDLIGRKLMVGDVFELPHLLDYNPLNETIPTSLRRYYQITDSNYASEGFSATWYPHLWRIKCEPLVDSQEFSQILTAPINQDNYMGTWNATVSYPAGYVITYGDTNYTSTQEVPIGIAPPNTMYWAPDTNQNLKDILSTYNKNIAVNDAILVEAARLLPKSGYDNSNLYVVPTYGPGSDEFNQPAPPTDINTNSFTLSGGIIVMMRSPKYKTASPVIRLPANTNNSAIAAFLQMSLETITLDPTSIGNGSGPVEGDTILSVQSLGSVSGPYGTSDNMYATTDQDPAQEGIDWAITSLMDFRSDVDPAFQFISRYSPRSFGYTVGYLTGTEAAPNGLPVSTGISFPVTPAIGDYFLRTDYLPQLLYRWDGRIWIRISSNVRTDTGFTSTDGAQQSTFINNSATTLLTDGTSIPQRQALSTILTVAPDPFPPII